MKFRGGSDGMGPGAVRLKICDFHVFVNLQKSVLAIFLEVILVFLGAVLVVMGVVLRQCWEQMFGTDSILNFKRIVLAPRSFPRHSETRTVYSLICSIDFSESKADKR